MSQVESGRVVTLTEMQAWVLEAARGLVDRGIRVTESSVAGVLGIGGTKVRSHLAVLRKCGLLAKHGRVVPSGPVAIEVVVRATPPASSSTASNRGRRSSSMAAVGLAARRAAKAEQASLRARFEVAARVYEAVRTNVVDFPIAWRIAHDQLLNILTAYARLRGADPCVCDGIAYYPNPSGDGFVRNTRPSIRHGIHSK